MSARVEVDAATGLHRLDAERHRQVRLAGAGRAEDMKHLVAVDELELGEGQDTVAVERGLEGEVEAASVLTAVSRAITSAVLMRRLSRTISSSASRVSMASSGETSPHSSWRTVRSRTSSARGASSRPTRVRRIRSRWPRRSGCGGHAPLSLAGETAADGRVDGE